MSDIVVGMAERYTTDDEIRALAGEVGIELRADDAVESDLMERAVSYSEGRIDFYCQDRYLANDLADSQYVRDAATAFALEWWSVRRFNAVVEPLVVICDRYREELMLVLQRKANVPRTPRSRRAVAVTNFTTDLRRANNQGRVDQNRSTGVAAGYRRQTDPTSPDQR